MSLGTPRYINMYIYLITNIFIFYIHIYIYLMLFSHLSSCKNKKHNSQYWDWFHPIFICSTYVCISILPFWKHLTNRNHSANLKELWAATARNLATLETNKKHQIPSFVTTGVQHYPAKQWIIIGKSLKMTMHFYCLFPPIWSNLGNLMNPPVNHNSAFLSHTHTQFVFDQFFVGPKFLHRWFRRGWLDQVEVPTWKT